MTSFMVSNAEIERLLYVKQDSIIAHSLGVPKERVAKIRAEKQKPVFAEPKLAHQAEPRPLPEPLETAMEQKPVEPAPVLTPHLCPACGSPVTGGRVMIAHIQALVAAYYSIPVREMTSQRRQRAYSHPRQVAMYLAYELTPQSFPEIGKRFGGKDHTTVIHAVKAVQQRMLERVDVEADVKALRERLAA